MKAIKSDGESWACSHPEYGTWVISKASVIADWKFDHRQAYPSNAEREPCEEEIQTWLNEQISWCEISHYGKQIQKPDFAAIEKLWLANMALDVDLPENLRHAKVFK